ncbi:glycosyltransferase [Limosilactobacillus vaginalis]|uniref:glycosyltransferase n=1 Tax=Limosilactobacillus vaginalis TaxID=1633 RepID=UPI0025A4A06B|nr:glycosyltransferase family 2 protein [Limosilactobacillus vaginalis]MDM8244393.1 glycosyltransferase family 2 protein [Limosilactobacillus vaginalis]
MEHNLLIVILNYNCFSSTIKCVKSIKASNKNLLDTDIVIVDNCSTDKSYKKLKDFFNMKDNITVVKTKRNGGYSYGNNYGIRYMLNRGNKYKFFSIVNPDVVFQNANFEYQMNVLSGSNEYAAIGSLIYKNNNVDLNNQAWVIPSIYSFCFRTFLLIKNKNVPQHDFKLYKDNIVEAGIIPGSFFIIKANIFQKIGLFDENIFMYNEETVLSIKLANINMKVLLDLAHTYNHNHKISPRKIVWENYKYNYSHILKMYDYFYESRKYVCKKYYRSRSHLLDLIIICNKILLYLKHIIAIVRIS